MDTTVSESEWDARAWAVLDEIRAAREMLEDIARSRAPLTLAEAVPKGNVRPDIQREINAFIDSLASIDASELDSDDMMDWELLTGSDRFTVREDPDGWVVVDTTRDEVSHDATDEDDASIIAAGANVEDLRDNLCGFPVAHCTMWRIRADDQACWEASGFIVYSTDRGLFAGIDGGGYDFYAAHWAPLMWALRPGRLVETDCGPRVIG